jgi:hypothetical protein
VSKDDYVKAFEAATREMETLLQQRADLDHRILHLRQTLVSLSHLCGFTPTVSWGMTDGVRFILRRAQHPLTAVDVRDELANWGFDMSKYANDLSAIHTVLKRLNKAGEIRFVPRSAGSQAYEWHRSGTPANIMPDKPQASTKAKK